MFDMSYLEKISRRSVSPATSPLLNFIPLIVINSRPTFPIATYVLYFRTSNETGITKTNLLRGETTVNRSFRNYPTSGWPVFYP